MHKELITIREINNNDNSALGLGRTIFMNYFVDLYKNIPEQTLQINGTTQTYLKNIFDKTEQALRQNKELYAFLAYMDQIPVGFSTCGALENPELVLIRTLPINLDHKNIEQEIRLAFMAHVHKKFPSSQQIVIMVRKANKVHEELCYQTGFKQNNDIFNYSAYLRDTYDQQCYNGYVYTY
jgi:hypothetical protein